MNHPVVTLNTIENVGRLMDILLKNDHNGFPVVDPYDEVSVIYLGREVRSPN